MTLYNPRVLANKLNDLTKELADWTSVARETLSTATNDKAHAEEAVKLADQAANIMKNQYEADKEAVKKVEEAVEQQLDICFEAKETAHLTLLEAEKTLVEANTTLEHWREELALARAWLERAREKLRIAIIALHQAQNELYAALSALRAAESNLSACRNDESRRNCWGEQAAVNRALVRVNEARAEVDRAELEVRAAEEEVARAEARVACCEVAVGYAEEALKLAELAQQNATEAVNYAERSLENVHAASRSLKEAKEALVVEEEAVSSMMLEMQAAKQYIQEVAINFNNAAVHQESAQKYSLDAQKELERKEQELHELNRPSNDLEGAIGKAVAAIAPKVIYFFTGIAAATAISTNIAMTQLDPGAQPVSDKLQPSNVLQLNAYDRHEEENRQRAEELQNIQDDAEKILEASYEAFEKAQEEDEERKRRLKG